MAAKALQKSTRWTRWTRGRRGRPGLDIKRNHVRVEEKTTFIMADKYSDGKTSEEKTKQILAVVPILSGQTASQNNSSALPPRKDQPALQPFPQPQQQPATQSNDLIDFGQSNSLPTTSVPERNSSLQQQTTHPTTYMPSESHEPVMPGHPIKRVDTLTKDLDEFVDAPGSS